ncbi:sulfur carrier protein ThiS [Shewanella mesophila]|uniref:sulfur carrier protein ThiS n=1 Tax=Shewanella mesophila TaxID=2864208 RepID=UPI001C6606BF|nr:sulfur carrier protein ThiS [Shewanella mesophila]QYJ87739.1 sulfur carrier protein ThiS [Shewanella mesophila]
MSKVQITINGQALSIADNSSLQQILLDRQVALDSVALLKGSRVVPKSQWAFTTCVDGDVIELFGVVAGG